MNNTVKEQKKKKIMIQQLTFFNQRKTINQSNNINYLTMSIDQLGVNNID